MSVDVFGRALKKEGTSASPGPPGIGYKLTDDANFDIESKRLCNVAEPIEANDAVNLQSVRALINSCKKEIFDELEKKFDELTELAQNHRDEIEHKILKINFDIHKLNNFKDE